MNILVTTWCNRRECTFCFEQSVSELKAQGATGRSASNREFISAEDYEYLLDLAAHKWHSQRICLMGGEPTQHPLIGRFVAAALELGLEVLLLTNGVFNAACSEQLSDILFSEKGEKLFFLMNPYLRPEQPVAELAAIRTNLKWMGSACTLAITVVDDRFELGPLADLILEFGLNPLIRVSLAHPMLENENTFAAREKFCRIGHALKEQGKILKHSGIRLMCDCGFVACMFADPPQPFEAPEAAIRRGLADLEHCGLLFKSVCHPLMDVQPDLKVGYCLPLAPAKSIKLTHDAELSREALADRLHRHFESQISTFLFASCSSCELRLDGTCRAGCQAYRLRAQRELPE